VFERIALGSALKCLTIVDDATLESIAVVAERSMSGTHLTRIVNDIGAQRDKPVVNRSDNGKE
jgi:hypothetical protein